LQWSEPFIVREEEHGVMQPNPLSRLTTEARSHGEKPEKEEYRSTEDYRSRKQRAGRP
jgi:hypothetical protein